MKKHGSVFLFVSSLTYLVCFCGTDEIYKGDECLRLGDYRMARSFYERTLERDPGAYKARLGLSKALLQAAAAAKGDTALWSLALIQLEAARTLAPLDSAIAKLLAEAWLVRGQRFLASFDSSGAMDAFKRAMELDARSTGALNLCGALAFTQGNDSLAESLFKRSLAVDSTEVASWFNLGAVFWNRGNTAEARRMWEIALLHSPKDRTIALWRDKALHTAGKAAVSGEKR
jgi:tetratricopeptide (TPR) repeat protein